MSRRKRRLYRDRENAVICGVCAGIADHYGFDLGVVRAAVIVSCLFAAPFTITAYVVLCFVIPAKPVAEDAGATAPPEDPDEKSFRQGVNRAPRDTYQVVRHNLRGLEDRLQRMERYVTSRHYELDREFRDLET